MREVFGAVIATALVLIAVFVPVAFFPGHDRPPVSAVRADDRVLGGDLGVQRADADAGAVGAAAAARRARQRLVLRPDRARHPRRRRNVYVPDRPRADARALGGGGRSSSGCSALTYYVYNRVPQAFVPEEDAGYFISIVQAPPGASLEYTTNVVEGGREDPAGRARGRVGVLDPRLQLRRQRAEPGADLHAAQAVRRAGAAGAAHPGAAAAAARPAVRHPGRARHPVRAAGDQHRQLRRLHVRGARPGRRGDIQSLGTAVQALVGASQQSTQVAGLFSSFTANDPQLAVDIDREKARSLGLPISEITSAMQIYLGSAVRQRLRFQQPRLPRLRAGGQGVPVGPARPRAVLRAHDERATWCRSPTSCACARRRRRR